MRKIAANYIYIPNFPLTKNGYIIIDNNQVRDVINTQETIREIHGLEFYGGMIVALNIKQEDITLHKESNIITFLTEYYSHLCSEISGLALITHADLNIFTFLEETKIEPLLYFN